MSPATTKKRSPRLSPLATTKMGNEMAKTPDDRVKTLYGMGVSPARNTAQKSHRSYRPRTRSNASGVTPGTYSKKTGPTSCHPQAPSR